jgi:peptidoglycan/xylan/chitin deacetylase (PgdA/CDA1 family)
VALTFDDGFYDFSVHAAPAMAAFGFPSTVYLTTYYVDHQVPIFNLMVSYLLWKGRGAGKSLPDGTPLVTEADARLARKRFLDAVEPGTSAPQKEGIARQLARDLNLDYGAFSKSRLLHLMNSDEVKRLAQQNVTFEAHTHRHCMPAHPELMRRELRDNMTRIEELVGRRPRHFCYPSGNYRREFFPIFEEEDLLSATTCLAGISSRADDRFLMPRFLDHTGVTRLQFEGWLSGLYAVGRSATR